MRKEAKELIEEIESRDKGFTVSGDDLERALKPFEKWGDQKS